MDCVTNGKTKRSLREVKFYYRPPVGSSRLRYLSGDLLMRFYFLLCMA
jgi:hypothetical protein